VYSSNVAEWRTLTVAIVAGLAGACSLLVDTSGLGAGGSVSGGSDGSVVDGNVADAPAGDNSSGEGGQPTSCGDPARAFCDAFDQGPLGARWNDMRQTNGALALDDGAPRSAPSALRASTTGAGEAEAVLVKQLPAGTKQIRCEFDFSAPLPPGSAGEVDLIVFLTHLGGSNTYQTYLWYSGAWQIGEYSQSMPIDHNGPVGSMPTDRWAHMVFETDGKQLTLSADGQVIAQLPGLASPAGTTTEIDFGIPYAKGRAAYSALFDNLACTFGP
jgi:hypothetical protein